MKGSKLKTRDYLALDLGATSGRAILGNLDGDRLSLREVHRFPNGPIERNGHLHWDLPRILSEVEIGIAKAFELSPELVGMACDSWGVDHGFQDNDGQPIDLPFSYQDSRTQGILETPPLSGNAERIFQRTAAPSTPISTLSQLVVTKKNNHDLWSQARQFLFTPDWVHHHLTGVSVCERTMASTSQLHSWQNGNWDWDLAEEMGIESSLFPMIGTAGDRIGELKSDLANRLKVNGCPVHLPACHDTASAFAAAPCVNEETVILSSGTWSMLGIRVANPILAGEIFELGGGNYALPGNDWALSRGIMGLWLLDRFKNEEGFESLRELVELAKTAEPLACLIDPENPLFQERDPIANLIRQWAESTHQPVPNSPGAITRTILESLALFNREAACSLARMTGRTLKRLVIVGGGSRNELLNQMTADASGVEVVMGPSESTAIGNILVQAVGAGDLGNFSEIRGVVESSFPIKTFSPRNPDQWTEAKEKYDSLNSIRIEPVSTNRRR